MKSIDVMDVESAQSIETIKNAQKGRAIKILPDTFLFKIECKDGSLCQGYALRHINRHDIVLIDAVDKDIISEFQESGYDIKGIFLTSRKMLDDTNSSFEEISKSADAPIFIHPLDTREQSKYTKDITAKHELLNNFALSVYHFPGVTGGSVVVYTEINGGTLFAGDSAVGSDYESKDNNLTRPENNDSAEDFGLAETWTSFVKEFTHVLPRRGKPCFDLSEGEQKDVLSRLGRSNPIS